MRALMVAALAVAGTAGAVAVAIAALRSRVLLAHVSGFSMLPAHGPGDRLLVRRRSGARVRPGDVVLLDGGRLKRVAAVAGDPVPEGVRSVVAAAPVVPAGHLVLLGDNPSHSTDSRLWGFVPCAQVVGVVWRTLPRVAAASGSAVKDFPVRERG